MRKGPARQPVKPAAPLMTPAASTAPQKFAVQLIWSTDPVDAARVPQLAIFDAYTLYTVHVERAGRRWHGLRLGFFTDPVSARQVSLYARSDFSAAAVVPVSERECARANEVAAGHAQRPSPTHAAGAQGMQTRFSSRKTTRPAPGLHRCRIIARSDHPGCAPTHRGTGCTGPRPGQGESKASRTRSTQGSKRVSRTTAQLLEELGAGSLDLDLEIAGGDGLSDTGVRHLSVSVVHRKSPLGRLLDRVGRRRQA